MGINIDTVTTKKKLNNFQAVAGRTMEQENDNFWSAIKNLPEEYQKNDNVEKHLQSLSK